jgi:hypothetical protein
MNIMILGHKEHGKTTLAELLNYRFGFTFVDTTIRLRDITKEYLTSNPQLGLSSGVFHQQFHTNKDKVRHVMVEALADYNKDDPVRFIKEQFERCNVYAGCRSNAQYEAAKPFIDLTFWIKDNRKEENDPTMEIEYQPDMILIDNSGTKLQLESKVKQALHQKAGVPIRMYDQCLRDSIVSSIALNPTNNISIE